MVAATPIVATPVLKQDIILIDPILSEPISDYLFDFPSEIFFKIIYFLSPFDIICLRILSKKYKIYFRKYGYKSKLFKHAKFLRKFSKDLESREFSKDLKPRKYAYGFKQRIPHPFGHKPMKYFEKPKICLPSIKYKIILDSRSIILQRKTKHFSAHIDFLIIKDSIGPTKIKIIFPRTKKTKSIAFDIDPLTLFISEPLVDSYKKWTGCAHYYWEVKQIIIALYEILDLQTISFHKFIDLFD